MTRNSAPVFIVMGGTLAARKAAQGGHMDDIAIDTLATVTGGAITAHSAARALDVITPERA